jgi:hypothetical protein
LAQSTLSDHHTDASLGGKPPGRMTPAIADAHAIDLLADLLERLVDRLQDCSARGHTV